MIIEIYLTETRDAFEIFRGPVNADGSSQEFIALPLDMVEKLRSDSEERDALKKEVDRLDSFAKEVRFHALFLNHLFKKE